MHLEEATAQCGYIHVLCREDRDLGHGLFRGLVTVHLSPSASVVLAPALPVGGVILIYFIPDNQGVNNALSVGREQVQKCF